MGGREREEWFSFLLTFYFVLCWCRCVCVCVFSEAYKLLHPHKNVKFTPFPSCSFLLFGFFRVR